jgi:hypothetical protein
VLHRILLNLARDRDHPEGSPSHGYEIVAPLDADSRLDAHAWRDVRTRCLVRRFWNGERDRHGRLVHRAGGPGGGTWLIDYDDRSTADDEPGYRLNTHRFAKGEYVSIRDSKGAMHTFRVVALENA